MANVSKLDKAKAQIVLDHPFFASILLKKQLTVDNTMPTLAVDAWINDMLNDCGVGESIPNTVNMPGSKDKTTETIYDELPTSPKGSG